MCDAVGAGQRDQTTGEDRNNRAFKEDKPMPISRNKISHHGAQHCHTKRGHKQTDDISNRPEIHHAAALARRYASVKNCQRYFPRVHAAFLGTSLLKP